MTVGGATSIVPLSSRNRPAGCSSISISPFFATAASVPSKGRYACAGEAKRLGAINMIEAKRFDELRKGRLFAGMRASRHLVSWRRFEHPDRRRASGTRTYRDKQATHLRNEKGSAGSWSSRNAGNALVRRPAAVEYVEIARAAADVDTIVF